MVCLICTKPWVLSPALQNKNKKTPKVSDVCLTEFAPRWVNSMLSLLNPSRHASANIWAIHFMKMRLYCLQPAGFFFSLNIFMAIFPGHSSSLQTPDNMPPVSTHAGLGAHSLQ